ncbi:MAG: 4-hydroxybenzoate octaprenyltransferase [Lacrimispora sp.]|uniref:4-hydroxybenzoate octaprenyltransferase n=1 Tax=Lacrimispora sp. TaxID=2719234 RepID=UPI0039E2E83D
MGSIIRKTVNKLNEYGKLVMFSHTIFSLAFAAVSLLAVSDGRPKPEVVFWAALAFLSARTGANALNRVVDARIDAKNPRTSGRQIPQGQIGKKETLLLVAVCFLVMVVSASRLNVLCLILSPVALFLMTVYSYTKRFTWTCHLILGITCACAPVGAWLAVTGKFSLVPLLFGAANCLWTAGFDIIYGSQDYEFDRANGLHSIPVRFGVKGGLLISTLFHGTALFCLCAAGVLLYPQFGLFYGIGIGIIAVLMVIQHRMVSPDRLENVNIASYSISQITSVVLLVFGVLDVYL